MLRDQKRAFDAFRLAKQASAKGKQFGDYRNAANDLPVHLVRSGLVAALANLQRVVAGRPGAMQFRADLCAALPVHLKAPTDELLDWAAKLSTDQYMLASREMMKLAVWFKRAVQGQAK